MFGFIKKMFIGSMFLRSFGESSASKNVYP